MSKIICATANDDYTFEIELDNHHKIIYDMKPRLHAARFCKLSDLDRFKAVQVENGNAIVWDSLCQISIDEIINNIER
ncbi:MAG: DUF2442 domain-containing protein [Oscillospiraceae bacterium]|nr:DUF2442 domain-containing protein [Oscillospiraceae bacterium]